MIEEIMQLRPFLGVLKVVVLDECVSDQYNYVIKTCHKTVHSTAFSTCLLRTAPSATWRGLAWLTRVVRSCVCIPGLLHTHELLWGSRFCRQPGILGDPTSVYPESGEIVLSSTEQ